MAIELPVRHTEGSDAGVLSLSELAFGRDFNEPLIHQVVVACQAGRRAGTRAQKNRAAVRGGGAKPRPQKGSGRARAGTIRSPLWRGGGVTFPAAPKDFSHKVNRKMYRAAMRSILSELHRRSRLLAVDALTLSKPSTQSLLATLKLLTAAPGKAVATAAAAETSTAPPAKTPRTVLIVLETGPHETADDTSDLTNDIDRNIQLSARNLGTVSVCASRQIDPVSLISHDCVLATVDALKQIDHALQ